jgi:hypothetical protein
MASGRTSWAVRMRTLAEPVRILCSRQVPDVEVELAPLATVPTL